MSGKGGNRKQELSGVRIAHNYDELEEGVDYILTAADEPILLDGNRINDKETSLINVELESGDRLKKNLKAKEKAKMRAFYQREDPDEYAAKKSILSKYDEEQEKAGIILGEGGEYDASKVAALNNIKSNMSAANKNVISLETPKVFQSEYATAEEEEKKESTKFKKPKKLLKKRKNDEDIVEILQNQLKGKLEEDHHASRKTVVDRNVEAQKEMELSNKQKRQNFNAAMEKAKEKTTKAVEDQREEDDYHLIEQSIEKQRRLLQSNLQKKVRPELALQEFLRPAAVSEAKEGSTSSETKEGQTSGAPEEKKSVGGVEELTEVEISDTTSFLQSVETEKERQDITNMIVAPSPFTLKSARDGMTSVLNIPLPSEQIRGGLQSSMYAGRRTMINGVQSVVPGTTPVPAPPEESFLDKEISKKDEDEINALHEPLVGKGIGRALELFRMRGVLGVTEYVGRSKDKTPEEEMKKFGVNPENDKIKLEYRDNQGKKLTTKEAFRYMCWRFHGKMPSENKRAKKKEKDELQSKLSNMDMTKDSRLVKALQKTQKKQKVPYLVLDSKAQK